MLPTAMLWSTTSPMHPDDILVTPLDETPARYAVSAEERNFVAQHLVTKSRKDEGLDYRMVEITRVQGGLRIKGATGRWFDHDCRM